MVMSVFLYLRMQGVGSLVCKLLLFFWLAIFAMSRLAAQEILIAAEDSWPPFSDQSGNGVSRALVTAALAREGVQAKIFVVPYARALNDTETGKVNACWNVTRQPSTEKQFIFGEEALLTARASYFYAPDSDLDFTSVESIPDQTRVGVIIDYEYGSSFSQHQQRFKLTRVNSQAQLIKLLLSKRIDVAIMFDEVAQYTLQTVGIPASAIIKGQQNHVSDIYVAFSRKYKESRALAAKLDKGLRALKASGEYERLFAAGLQQSANSD
ncbi:substrate-binding periplasmic protein [Endozoicomonas sp.]|uniref:substrate-binding periplasmic protein n=1 Tax=Endozoicomonas sp. TaxID=1892382 RepID=UPI0028850D1D|nr:transporter substrate-binding domain-containing protein [Endozoicomonas sp.]